MPDDQVPAGGAEQAACDPGGRPAASPDGVPAAPSPGAGTAPAAPSPGAGTVRPGASSAVVRARMQRQRRRDTKPEVEVRRLLHAAGVRFRVDVKPEPDLRVRGDIVWRGRKVVVFVDGCFWHGCPEHATQPKANADWWRAKLAGNVARDRRTDAELAARGWTVLRYWEHEPAADVAGELLRALGAPP